MPRRGFALAFLAVLVAIAIGIFLGPTASRHGDPPTRTMGERETNLEESVPTGARRTPVSSGRRIQVSFRTSRGDAFTGWPVQVFQGTQLLERLLPPTTGTVEIGCGSEVRELRFVATGYEPVSRSLPEFASQHSLEDVAFVPRSRLDVTVLGATNRHSLQLIVSTAAQERVLVSGITRWGRSLEVAGDVATASIPVPSESNLSVLVTGPGLVFPYGKTLRLDAGSHDLVLNLSDTPSVQGQLIGLPADAVSDRTILMAHAPRTAGASPGEAATLPRELRTRTDSRGCFRFLGLESQQTVSLTLEVEDRVVPIAAPRSEALYMVAGESRQPVPMMAHEPVIGLRLSVSGQPRPAFAVGFDGPPMRPPNSHPANIALVSRSGLAAASEVWIRLSGGATSRVDPQTLSPPVNDVIDLSLPSSSLDQSGRIRVVAGAEPPAGMSVEAVRRSRSPPAVFVEHEVADTGDGWIISGLQPGEYDIRWRWERGSTMSTGNVADVHAGSETVVHAMPPFLVTWTGVIVNWDEIPTQLQPLNLVVNRGTWPIREGRFEVNTTLESFHDARFEGPHGERVAIDTLPQCDQDTREVEIAFPLGSVRAVVLPIEPVLEEGRCFAEYAIGPIERIHQHTPVRRVHASSQQLVLWHEGEQRWGGWVWEWNRHKKVLRGWFVVDSRGRVSTSISDPPRSLNVEVEPVGGLFNVYLMGESIDGWRPPAIRVTTIDGAAPATVLVPRGTKQLLIENERLSGTADLSDAQIDVVVRVQ